MSAAYHNGVPTLFWNQPTWASGVKPCARKSRFPNFSRFPVNARRAPIRVRGRHPFDSSPDLRTRLGPAATGSLRNPGPIDSEGFPLPTDDGVTVHDVQGLPSGGLDTGKGPLRTIGLSAQSRDPFVLFSTANCCPKANSQGPCSRALSDLP
jgi:hypothetical protein